MDNGNAIIRYESHNWPIKMPNRGRLGSVALNDPSDYLTNGLSDYTGLDSRHWLLHWHIWVSDIAR